MPTVMTPERQRELMQKGLAKFPPKKEDGDKKMVAIMAGIIDIVKASSDKNAQSLVDVLKNNREMMQSLAAMVARSHSDSSKEQWTHIITKRDDAGNIKEFQSKKN